LPSNAWEGAVVSSAQPDVEEFDLGFLDVEGAAAMQWDVEVDSRPLSRATPLFSGGRDSATNLSHSFVQNWNDAPWLEYPTTSNPSPAILDPRTYDNIPQEIYVAELSRKLFMTDFSAPPWPSPKTIPTRMLNLLSRRPVEKLGSTLRANFLFSTIQSYPEMLSTSCLPPFIHRYFGRLNTDLPGPLANFMTFLSMWRSQTPASEKFVYKTLFLEAQRLHNEVRLTKS
jgi:hypothetical protein